MLYLNFINYNNATMKTKYFLSLLITTSLVVVSCKKETETVDTAAPKQIIMPRVESFPVAAASQVAPAPTQNMPVTTPTGTTTQTPPANQAPVKVAAGMNPSHGQPGHRCDIAVGAPLNSAAKAPATPAGTAASSPYTVTQTPTTPTSTTTSASTPALLNPTGTTAPGMNPAHGQAGHRCDIAVGAALPKS